MSDSTPESQPPPTDATSSRRSPWPWVFGCVAALVLTIALFAGLAAIVYVRAHPKRGHFLEGAGSLANLERRLTVKPVGPLEGGGGDVLVAIRNALDARLAGHAEIDDYWLSIENGTVVVLLDRGVPPARVAELAASLKGVHELRVSVVKDRGAVVEFPKRGSKEIVRVALESGLSSADVKRAYRSTDSALRPALGVELTKAGGERFYEFTRVNVGQQIAIILDGQVLMAPVLRSAIQSSLIVEGGANGFREDEVRELIEAFDPKNRYPVPVDVTLVPDGK